MRTKTLLIAAAALAVGVITSQAQPVYSQNIVGYVNQPFPAGEYTVVTAPLATTSTNSPEDALGNMLQTGDDILYWNGTQFATYSYLSPQQWIYPDGSTVGPAPNLGNGNGFFYLNNQGATETNTFVGTVILTNTVSLPAGHYALIGSTPAIGGSLDDTNINLPLQTGDDVLIWSSTANQYSTYSFLSVGQWIYPDGSTIGPAPVVNVDQAFFYLNNQGASEIWTNNFTVQ
jgi:hypothetical protein